ncbi:COG2931 RTX toxins and related Ca2+-binding proteins [Rhabdaerophilaceae bacterium]
MCLICGLGLSRTSHKEDAPFEVQSLFLDGPQGVPGGPLANLVETTDAAASKATTYALSLSQIASGTISTGGDVDWYAVNLTAGTAYTVALVGTETNNLQNPLLRLIGTDGTSIVATNDNGLQSSNSVLTYTPSATGTFYINAAATSSTATGTYRASITTGTKALFDHEMGAGVIDSDAAWNSTPGTAIAVTYGFRAGTPPYNPGGYDLTQVSRLTQVQIDAVRLSLASIADVANITFTEVNPGGYTDNATMLFNNYFSKTDGAGAFAYYPSPAATAGTQPQGDVWLNTNSVSTTSLPYGGYSYFVLAHEIGHAVGLAHPGLYNAAPGVSITYANSAQFAADTHQYSAMSYFDENSTSGALQGYPETLMLLDVMALQHIYGANTATRAGDTIYGFNNASPGMTHAGSLYDFITNPTPAYTIWDGNGRDRIDASGFTVAQTITLVSGAFSNISANGLSKNNVSIAYGATIEDAFGGSAADTITGNLVANTLFGNGGNDTIEGLAGNDALGGQDGDDRLWTGEGEDVAYGDAGADQVGGLAGNDSLFGGAGNDTIWGDAGNDQIGGNDDADSLYGLDDNDIIWGDGGNDSIWGGAGADRLFGFADNDRLDGEDGADELRGGMGLDTLYGGQGDDFLDGEDGSDSLFGGIDNDTLLGGQGSDFLDGADGNDSIFGWTDNDTLLGGQGDDLIDGEDGDDFLFGWIGNDTVYGGRGNDDLLGESGADFMWGFFGNDTLQGGAGNDTLGGEAGNDTYVYFANADVDDIIGFDGGAGVVDRIRILGQTAFDDFADVLAAATVVSGTLQLNLTGTTIRLIGFNDINQLDADDFLFV